MDHVIPGGYEYKGITLYEACPIEHVKNLKNFQLHHDDIVLVGYPKSGNIWLQTILAAIQSEDLELFRRNGPQCIRGPIETEYCAKRTINEIKRPNLILTHLRYSMLPEDVERKKVKVIYMMRNPKDLSVSYYHFVRMNGMLGYYRGTWDSFFDSFIQDKVPYGSWFDHIKEWMGHKDNKYIFFVTYENLSKNTSAVIKSLAEFIGKNLDADTIEKIKTITTFSSMKENEKLNLEAEIFDKNESPFLRKGEVGDWVKYYSTEQGKKWMQK